MAVGNTWFIRYRARAMTVISSAVPIGGTLVDAAARHRGAKLGLALGRHPRWNAIFSHRHSARHRRALDRPESMGLLPDGDAPRSQHTSRQAGRHASAAQAVDRKTPAVRQAMKTWVFWLFTIGMTVRVGAYSTISVHFVPIMVWKGLSPGTWHYLLASFRLFELGGPLRHRLVRR